jgi:UDP-N-acetylmuramoyl-tripeptide--D-alanyl-D-alanine ligase
MINILFYTIYLISFSIFLHKRTKLLMHFFQQEEYDNWRFMQYVSKGFKFIDKKLSGLILLSALILFVTKNLHINLTIISALLLFSAFRHINPCKKGKKVLVITQRVQRIIFISYLIFALILIGLFFAICNCVNPAQIFYPISIILIQLIPFIIIVANIILSPLEKGVRKRYLKEAKEKIAKLQPIVIGITGSYGKTSTKQILAHIMSSVVPTLATPGSVNTEMGITRVIREELKPEHKYFIVEMGAYCQGSIANRCQLTPPTYGIITAVGNAHYERFKSEANVAKTKFELAEAIFKSKKGKLIIDADAINKKYIDKYCKNHKDKLIKISSSSKEKNNYTISEKKLNKNGIEFKIKIDAKTFKIEAPLYGEHQIANVALSFALAYNLGISSESIIASLKSVPHIKHRLEVNKINAGPIFIDDAYNSNPTGFKSALATLKLLKQENGRTILITPGMAELGKLHNEKHFEIGEIAGKFVDIAIAIVPNRIKTFIDGFNKTAKTSQKLLTFDTFSQAKNWLDKNLQPRDTILYENDLPDLFETKIKI